MADDDLRDGRSPHAASGPAAPGGATNPDPPLVITTVSLPLGAVGTPYVATLEAEDGTPPYNWTIEGGSLPVGLSLDAATGSITGTPESVGTPAFVAVVTDSAEQTDSKPLSIDINPVLAVATVSLPNAIVGVPYNALLTAIGGIPPYPTWATTVLPPGLALFPSGQIAGTPTSPGATDFVATVTDSTARTASAPLQIAVVLPLALTIAGFPAAEAGAPFAATLAATGGTVPYTWSLAVGALPPGLSLNPESGSIAGIPTTPGTFDFTVAVTDRSLPALTASRALQILVAGAPEQVEIIVPVPPVGTVGVPYTLQMVATGGRGPYQWFARGTLPTGVALSQTSGKIAGVPKAAGESPVVAGVIDRSPLFKRTTAALTIAVRA